MWREKEAADQPVPTCKNLSGSQHFDGLAWETLGALWGNSAMCRVFPFELNTDFELRYAIGFPL